MARCFAYLAHHFIPCTPSSVLAEVSPELPEPPTVLRSQEQRLRCPDRAGSRGQPYPRRWYFLVCEPSERDLYGPEHGCRLRSVNAALGSCSGWQEYAIDRHPCSGRTQETVTRCNISCPVSCSDGSSLRSRHQWFSGRAGRSLTVAGPLSFIAARICSR